MKLEIGKVLKAQGIKGEIKISCYLDDAAMLKGTKQLYIGSNTYTVEKLRPDGAFCYVQLSGITDRNMAEALRNWSVYADKEYITVPQDRYFIADLIGCNVTLDDGTKVGVVKDVLQYGAADVFVCSDGEKEVSFPFLKDLVVQVNVEHKTVVVNKIRFGQVAVYED
ncbi:MAG: 16S rRNA processing protein RimM [Clostridiales bacterium]|nr:16S rRNA processing protein RimM [Clostridiales bacterium]